MRDCIFTDPRGDRFPYAIFFVHARNIRCVHIPANVSNHESFVLQNCQSIASNYIAKSHADRNFFFITINVRAKDRYI